jgi:hypothetical protein
MPQANVETVLIYAKNHNCLPTKNEKLPDHRPPQKQQQRQACNKGRPQRREPRCQGLALLSFWTSKGPCSLTGLQELAESLCTVYGTKRLHINMSQNKKTRKTKQKPAMDPLLRRHLPITTNRLEFFPQSIGPPPAITPRIDFEKRLEGDFESDSENDMCGDGDVMNIDASPATPFDDVSSRSSAEEPAEEIPDLLDTGEKKIPKPKGQPGHPRSGGYSLEFVLRNWGSTFSDVNVNN